MFLVVSLLFKSLLLMTLRLMPLLPETDAEQYGNREEQNIPLLPGKTQFQQRVIEQDPRVVNHEY
jgi:hypothetical protein